jgi:SAM-dependent methyltransferase
MTPLEPVGPNAEQIKAWNSGALYYFTHKDAIKAERGQFTRRLIERVTPAMGERALDVGCGFGDLTMELARRVGPTGFAVGIDLSFAMLKAAADSARPARINNIRFENVDAQTHAFKEREFDLAVSQFGVMFFADAVAAFRNIKSALRPGGRTAFVCWQSREQSQCFSIPLSAVARYIEPPPLRPPRSPGQFGLADPAFIREILDSAGFVKIEIDDVREELPIGGGLGLDDSVKWYLNVEFRAILAQVPSELRREIAEATRDALRPFLTDAGVLMESATWLVSACTPS